MADQISVPCDIAIPQVFHDGPVDMDLVRRHVETAEAMGYHGLWVQERFIGESPTLEGLSLLCYVAALTESVRLGTSVVVAPNHNPVHLAKQFSTMDQMSNGRLTIGLGLGGRAHENQMMGGAPDHRIRYFLEGLQVMKALWQEPKVNHHGHFWDLEDMEMEPKPVQKPYPPVWFGGHYPDALMRAVRHGDGWMGAGKSVGYDPQWPGESGVGEPVADGRHPLYVVPFQGLGRHRLDALGQHSVKGRRVGLGHIVDLKIDAGDTF